MLLVLMISPLLTFDPQMSISPENNESESNSMKIVVDNTYICQYCAQKFKSYFQLKSHMVEHKSEQVSTLAVATSVHE